MILASGGAVVGDLGALLGRPRGFLGPLGAILGRLGAVLARAEPILSRLDALVGPQEGPKGKIIDFQSVFDAFEAQKGSATFGWFLGRRKWRGPWGGLGGET